MKADVLYQHLKELAEKLNITVVEQSFKKVGFPVKSGFCIVKDEKLFVMDKNIGLFSKNRLLIEFLREQPLEQMYIPPAVRDVLEKNIKS
jgi:hypothetical protein